MFEQIRREYEHGVGSIKGVARKFGVHRRMVRDAIANAVPPARKTTSREKPKLGAAAAYIDEILAGGPEDAAEATAHRTPDLGAAAAGDTGSDIGGVHGTAVRAEKEAGVGVGRRRDVHPAELSVGAGSPGGLV